jgi:centromere protein I
MDGDRPILPALQHFLDVSRQHAASNVAGSKRYVRSEDDVSYLEDLEMHAIQYGLGASAMAQLSSVVADASLDDKTLIKLIWCMLPRAAVPAAIVFELLGCLGCLSVVVRTHLLKWFVLCSDVTPSSALGTCYPCLWHWLDWETCRPFVCHLLCRITSRSHVKPFRVRSLLAAHRKFGDEPWLLHLLRTFKTFCSNIVLPSAAHLGRFKYSAPIKSIDKRWRGHLERLQLAHSQVALPSLEFSSRSSSSASVASLLCLCSTRAKFQGIKSRATYRNYGINQITLSSAVTSIPLSATRSIGIEELSSIVELASDFKNVVFPDRALSLLTSRLGHHLLSLRPEPEFLFRLSSSLSFYVEQMLFHENVKSLPSSGTVITQLGLLTQFIQELIPEVDAIIARFLRVWDGVSHRDFIFQLLPFCRPRSFEQFHADYLMPLLRLFVSYRSVMKARIIRTLAQVIYRWSSLDWSAVYNLPEWRKKAQLVPGQAPPPPTVQTRAHLLFAGIVPGVNYFRVIQELVAFVEQLSGAAILTQHQQPVVEDAVLFFYETIVRLHRQHNLPFVSSPSVVNLSRLCLSTNPCSVSRACGVCASLRAEFDAFRRSGASSDTLVPRNGIDGINHFNSLIKDLCNTLWRDSVKLVADNDVGSGSVMFVVPPALLAASRPLEGVASNSFSITSAPAFISCARAYADSGADSQFVITPHSKFSAFTNSSRNRVRASISRYQFCYLLTLMQYLDHLLSEQRLIGVADFL